MAEIQELADSFKQQTNVNLRRDWIAKIQPSFREFGSKPVSIKLYEKWLLTDICESSHPCLPQNINTTTQIFTLNNTLQITKIKDISTPGYQQLLKLKDKVSISELENENKYFDKPTRRMYLLELTDGNITINGIECKPVHSLTPNVLPGAKIVLKGMIPVRKGYALLEGNNIEVLGGSVDHLVERNSMLALLSRELDLQIATTTTTTAPITTTTIPTATTTSTRAFQGVKTEAISITDEVKTENNTIDEMSIANDAFLDSVIDEIVDEHLNENFGSLTDFMDEDIEIPAAVEAPSPPTITLREFSHNMTQAADSLAYAYCRVFTLLSKLDTNPAFEWQLKAKIIDKEDTKIDVRFSDEILQKLIGFSGREFKEVIEPNKLDPTQKKRGRNGFVSCQSTLKTIDCRMLIRYNKLELPVVEKIE